MFRSPAYRPARCGEPPSPHNWIETFLSRGNEPETITAGLWEDRRVDVSDHIRLPDGRRLDVRMSGPPDGLPLIFHHGTPGAAVPRRALERQAHARGLRVVSMSRPGYGGSTRQPGRSVADVVADTAAVLAWTGSDQCLVSGTSGGGPHALACAARLPGAAAALVVAGVAPYGAHGLDWMGGMGDDNVTEFSAALAGEADLRPVLSAQRADLAQINGDEITSAMETLLPDVDRAVLTGEYGDDVAASFREAVRTGIDGWVDDDLAFTKPWGFDLGEISVPVTLWQGTADLMVPFTHGEWLAARIPGVRAHLEPGEGHLSITVGAAGRMLDDLTAAVRG